MAVLNARERASLHVLAFLFFRMGASDRAGRIYAALAALPTQDGESSFAVDAQAVLGQAAVALELGDAPEALEHVQNLLAHMNTQETDVLSPGARWATINSVAHLVRAQALRTLDRMEEALAATKQYQSMAGIARSDGEYKT